MISVLLLFGAAFHALALPSTPRPRQFTVSDGLSSNRLYKLAEDREGYLWIGSVDGLLRYDGRQFRTWRTADGLPSNEVYAVAVDRQDRIWAGTMQGLALLDADRRIIQPESADSYPELRTVIYALHAAADGSIWVSTETALFRFGPEGTVDRFRVGANAPPHDRISVVISLASDAKGRLWMGMEDGTAVYEGGRIQRIATHVQHMPYVNIITPTRDGAVWIGTGLGVSRYHPQLGSDLEPLPAPPETVVGLMLEDRQGHQWFETDRGLALYRSGRLQNVPLYSSLSMGIVRPSITSALQDHEGGLWFTTSGAGLWYLPADWSRFSILTRRLEDPSTPRNTFPSTLALADAAGTHLWLAGSGGVLERMRVDDGHIDLREHGIGGRFPVKSLLTASDGRIWMGYFQGMSIYTPATATLQRIAGGTRHVMSDHVTSIAEDAQGTLWLNTNNQTTLLRMAADGRWLAAAPVPSSGNITCLLSTPAGRIWVCNGHGVFAWNEDHQRFELIGSGVAPSVSAITFDPNHQDVFHALSPQGIFSYRSIGSSVQRLARIPMEETPVADAVLDRDGVLWAGTRRGLLRADLQKRHLRFYTVRDGLPGQEVLSNLVIAPDSSWIAAGTPEGLFLFDPRELKPSRMPPRLQIERIDLRRGNSQVPVVPGQPIRLRPGDRDLRVDARLASYKDNSAHLYQYRLEGFDNGWVDVGAPGERVFSTLPSGHYRLEMRASDADGVWSDTISLPVTVAPPWWRTGWALTGFALLAVCVLTLLALEYRARVRRQHAHALSDQRRELAEQASEAKTRFLATLGHEVRTPLTGVLGMSELLLTTPLETRQRGYAESIQRAGEHLLRLVNDALDLARVEAGRLELEAQAFDLRALVREVVDLMAPLAEQRGLQFSDAIDADVPESLLGDRTRMEQILLNLLGNALKFTETGHVALEVHTHAPQGIQMVVSDSGPGISAEQQQRLFRRFEQAEGARTTARYGGSGLGLAISQELAMAMGGGITLDSALGEGTTFTVTLPLPQAERTHGTTAVLDHAEQLRILLVEDEPTVADVVRGLLQRSGHTITRAAHGLEALTAATSQSFDLALIDLDLPGIDGIALAGHLRRQGFTQPLIVLTARADAQAEHEAMAAGFDGFLRKPVTGAMLTAAIRRVFEE